jgi:hypothetical protein
VFRLSQKPDAVNGDLNAVVFLAFMLPFVLFKTALDRDQAALVKAFPEAPPFFPEQPEIKIMRCFRPFPIRLAGPAGRDGKRAVRRVIPRNA